MKLTDLKDDMAVRYRVYTSGEAITDWSNGTLYVRRRTIEQTLPPKRAKVSGYGNVGDIIELVIAESDCPSFNQGHYVGSGQFIIEDYRLEIEGLE